MADNNGNGAAVVAVRPSMYARLQGTLVVLQCLVLYWAALLYHLLHMLLLRRKSYASSPFFTSPKQVQEKVHVYSLALIFRLWSAPHYRSGTFGADMRKNLRNVAVPGTGIPLSWFCFHPYLLLLPALLVLMPLAAFFAALRAWYRENATFSTVFHTQLLAPRDWFAYWRLNCRICSWHALVTGVPDYAMEDKFSFLQAADAAGVPHSPFDKTTKTIVMKDRNEEGGMGVYFYKNAMAGGDWIIQPVLENADSIAGMLPSNAPLSTFRVVTRSNWSIESSAAADAAGAGAGVGAGTAAATATAAAGTTTGATDDTDAAAPSAQDCISIMSCVFRAGRGGALTDHDSILFDVNANTGVVGRGTTNAHWYRMGPKAVLHCPWTSTHDVTHHPDGNMPVTGQVVPQIAQVLEVARNAHAKLLPAVPLAGWDVALVKSEPKVCLLEANLSCNFFRGTFDEPGYFLFMDQMVSWLERHDTATKSAHAAATQQPSNANGNGKGKAE